jgi:hypothetical protein
VLNLVSRYARAGCDSLFIPIAFKWIVAFFFEGSASAGGAALGRDNWRKVVFDNKLRLDSLFMKAQFLLKRNLVLDDVS